jgi:hypothetical protein
VDNAKKKNDASLSHCGEHLWDLRPKHRGGTQPPARRFQRASTGLQATNVHGQGGAVASRGVALRNALDQGFDALAQFDQGSGLVGCPKCLLCFRRRARAPAWPARPCRMDILRCGARRCAALPRRSLIRERSPRAAPPSCASAPRLCSSASLLLSAPAPLSPRTTLDLGQLAREPFRRNLLKATHDLPDSCESFLHASHASRIAVHSRDECTSPAELCEFNPSTPVFFATPIGVPPARLGGTPRKGISEPVPPQKTPEISPLFKCDSATLSFYASKDGKISVSFSLCRGSCHRH